MNDTTEATDTRDDGPERTPYYHLGGAETLLRIAVRQHGMLDDHTLAHVVRWLEDLERAGLSTENAKRT